MFLNFLFLLQQQLLALFLIIILFFLYLSLINVGLNMFLVLINMSTFRFSLSKKFLQLLVLQKLSIFTFGPSFKVNSYVEFIFLNKNFQKNIKYYKDVSQKIRIFLPKHELNMNFYIFGGKKFIFNLCFDKKFYFFFGVIFTIFNIFMQNFIKSYKNLLKNRD